MSETARRRPVSPSGYAPADEAAEEAAEGSLWGWLAVAVLAGCALLAAVIESLLVPLYAGSVLVPLAPALAVVSNIVLPALGRFAVGRTAGGAVPFVAWLAVVLVLSSFPRPEGDVIYPGGGAVEWCSYGTLLGGTAAGAIMLVRMTLAQAAPPKSAQRAVRR